MRLLKLMFAAWLAMACALAQAGDTAYTVRATELKAKPYTDAQTLASLEQDTAVVIITRRGSWSKVKVNKLTGWVKMLSLRLADVFQKSGDTGFRSFAKVAALGNSGSTATTGIRGLDEEKLHTPQPNPQEFEKLHTLAVTKQEAQQFAKAEKLSPAAMDYLPAPAAK